MNRPTLIRFGELSRQMALATSVVAALIFAAYFVTESYVFEDLGRYLRGQHDSPSLVGLLVLFTAIFIGYLSAGRLKLAEIGGTVVVVSVATMFVWCFNTISFMLSPVALALAAPAILHLSSVVFFRAAERRAAPVNVESQKQPAVAAPPSANERTYGEQELVVGAA